MVRLVIGRFTNALTSKVLLSWRRLVEDETAHRYKTSQQVRRSPQISPYGLRSRDQAPLLWLVAGARLPLRPRGPPHAITLRCVVRVRSKRARSARHPRPLRSCALAESVACAMLGDMVRIPQFCFPWPLTRPSLPTSLGHSHAPPYRPPLATRDPVPVPMIATSQVCPPRGVPARAPRGNVLVPRLRPPGMVDLGRALTPAQANAHTCKGHDWTLPGTPSPQISQLHRLRCPSTTFDALLSPSMPFHARPCPCFTGVLALAMHQDGLVTKVFFNWKGWGKYARTNREAATLQALTLMTSKREVRARRKRVLNTPP